MAIIKVKHNKLTSILPCEYNKDERDVTYAHILLFNSSYSFKAAINQFYQNNNKDYKQFKCLNF